MLILMLRIISPSRLLTLAFEIFLVQHFSLAENKYAGHGKLVRLTQSEI